VTEGDFLDTPPQSSTLRPAMEASLWQPSMSYFCMEVRKKPSNSFYGPPSVFPNTAVFQVKRTDILKKQGAKTAFTSVTDA